MTAPMWAACLGLAALGLGVALSRWKTTPTARPFVLAMGLASAWALLYALEVSASGLDTKLLWARLRFPILAALPVAWLVLALEYGGLTHRVSLRRWVILLVIPTVTAVLSFTMHLHDLFRTDFTLAGAGPGAALLFRNAPWYWVHAGYSVALSLAAVSLYARNWPEIQPVFRRQSLALILATIVPGLVDMLFTLGLMPWPHYNPAAASLLVTCLLLVWAVWRLHLFDLTPVARGSMLDNMLEPMWVLDAGGRLVDFNRAAQILLGLDRHSAIGQAAGKFMRRWPALLDAVQASGGGRSELPWGSGEARRTFEVEVRPIRLAHGDRLGRLIYIHDASQRKAGEDALQALNAELDRQVQGRTAELRASVAALQAEVGERQRAEESLRQAELALAQRVTDQSRKLAALYELTLLSGQDLSLSEILDQSLAHVLAAVGGQAACIHLRPAGRRHLRLAAHHGLPPGDPQRLAHLPHTWLPPDNLVRMVEDLGVETAAPDRVKARGLHAYLGGGIVLRGELLGALSIYWRAPRRFPVEDIALFSAVADQLGIVIENARLRRRFEAAAARVERRRLARDLHDSVMQSLHSLALAADTAQNRLRAGFLNQVDTSLEHIVGSANQAVKEMRLLLYELRRLPPDRVEFLAEIKRRLNSVEQRTSLDVRLDVDSDARWPRAWDKELLALTHEALNNALKHAAAGSIAVVVRRLVDGSVEIAVQDDGCGFDPLAPADGHVGLQNMAVRAARLGASLTIDSAVGRGTSIRLTLGRDRMAHLQ